MSIAKRKNINSSMILQPGIKIREKSDVVSITTNNQESK